MTRHLANRILSAFNAWRERRRMAKASAELARRVEISNPEIARLRQEIEKRARGHRKVEPLRRQLHCLVIAQLAKEQGRTLPERTAS